MDGKRIIDARPDHADRLTRDNVLQLEQLRAVAVESLPPRRVRGGCRRVLRQREAAVLPLDGAGKHDIGFEPRPAISASSNGTPARGGRTATSSRLPRRARRVSRIPTPRAASSTAVARKSRTATVWGSGVPPQRPEREHAYDENVSKSYHEPNTVLLAKNARTLPHAARRNVDRYGGTGGVCDDDLCPGDLQFVDGAMKLYPLRDRNDVAVVRGPLAQSPAKRRSAA